MEKYADMTGEGEQVKIVSGDQKGQRGIIKKASEGSLTISLPNGDETTVDEMAVEVETSRK